MRKVATARVPGDGFCRAMIYDAGDGVAWGVYLFLFRSPADGPCDADYLYDTVADAEGHAAELLGVSGGDWRPVPDPTPGCQEDRIALIPTVRGASGPPA